MFTLNKHVAPSRWPEFMAETVKTNIVRQVGIKVYLSKLVLSLEKRCHPNVAVNFSVTFNDVFNCNTVLLL
jgi:hypothetical protein